MPQDLSEDSSVETPREGDETHPVATEHSSVVWIGVLTGLWVQWSSLGGNLLLTDSKDAEILSVVWSCATSALGIAVLALLRSVLLIADPYLEDDVLLSYESHFAMGALTAVCGGWIVTDSLLGYDTSLGASLVGLLAALAWCKLLTSCFRSSSSSHRRCESKSDGERTLEEPLLVQENEEKAAQAAYHDFRVHRCKTVAIGCFVGIFVQLASMGMNYMVQTMQPATWLLFPVSIAWSMFIAGMSASLLYLLRRLVLLHSRGSDQTQHLVWAMESYVSVGALMGVNVAWVLARTALGIPVSLASVVLPLLWSKLMLVYFVRHDHFESNDDDDMEVDEPVLVV